MGLDRLDSFHDLLSVAAGRLHIEEALKQKLNDEGKKEYLEKHGTDDKRSSLIELSHSTLLA